MTVPITGPFSKFEYLNGSPTPLGFIPRIYERSSSWYRQKKPYDLPLSYTFYQRRVLNYHKTVHGDPDFNYTETVSVCPSSVGPVTDLYNRVYNQFKEAVSERVELGVALAEGKQAMEMIEKRLLQIVRFTNALRKGRFGVAAREINVRLSDTRYKQIVQTYAKDRKRQLGLRNDSSLKDQLFSDPRRKGNILANLYLEFHFGWSPLMKDIHDAAEVLSSPFIPHSIRVRKRKLYKFPAESFTDNGTDKTWRVTAESIEQIIKLEANVEVVNPNIALREQCGLSNPLTIAWEIVPFSFVVDWFVNVGDFLQSFTDFAGVAITSPQRTIFSRWRKSYSETTDFNYHSLSSWEPGHSPFSRYGSDSGYTAEGFYHQRILGSFPGPVLSVRNPWTLSARRGLAAASLLMQVIGPNRFNPAKKSFL